MHSKIKGNIGELVVAAEFAKKSFHVFSELGDLSKVDLIVESPEGKLLKIQVKYSSLSKNGTVYVSSRKSGPNYEFFYTKEDFDIIAVYCPEIEQVAYITSKELLENKTEVTLRVTEPKNLGGSHSIRYFSSYTSLDRILEKKPESKGSAILPSLPVLERKSKINWPEKEKLEFLIKESSSLEKLAKELGVSSNAIRKHCKKYGITYS